MDWMLYDAICCYVMLGEDYGLVKYKKWMSTNKFDFMPVGL